MFYSKEEVKKLFDKFLDQSFENLIFINDQEVIETEEWIKLGNPHLWTLVEEYKNYSVFYDAAYGNIALLKDLEIIDISKSLIFHGDIVVFDKNIYSRCLRYIYVNPDFLN